ncbi:hypothetical protein [Streptomyces yaizuensis]|uniref:Uncharacterized protein n=1 Tax=Streptomyces yaizuensis TaxID=2989713 RepID=A0AA86MBG4_9ACTN|nr:hypothetical protein [Streptomyces sp. YSPA8]BDT39488.1 hypothetical protein SYYSPA8_36850 [Streptomyces sp. YSPA8]
MPAFKRLTAADLDRLTRAELLDRIEKEGAYWDRKVARGMTADDAAAYQEFSRILHAALNPGAMIQHATRFVQGHGDNGYWAQKPGSRELP